MNNRIVEIECKNCGLTKFKVIYDSNYCEVGETMRLLCASCGNEQDWHAEGNLQWILKNEEVEL